MTTPDDRPRHRFAPTPHTIQAGLLFQRRLKAAGLSQRDLHGRLGVALSTVSAWCTGRVPEIPRYALAYLDLYERLTEIEKNVSAARTAA